LQFAQLIKAQIAAAYAVIRERDIQMETPPLDPGEVTPGDPGSPEYQLIQEMMRTGVEIGPGMEWIGAPGERLSGFSPNIPNTEFFQHAKMLLTFLAINLDLPLAVLMLDPSDTNFSGWRRGLEQNSKNNDRKILPPDIYIKNKRLVYRRQLFKKPKLLQSNTAHLASSVLAVHRSD